MQRCVMYAYVHTYNNHNGTEVYGLLAFDNNMAHFKII